MARKMASSLIFLTFVAGYLSQLSVFATFSIPLLLTSAALVLLISRQVPAQPLGVGESLLLAMAFTSLSVSIFSDIRLTPLYSILFVIVVLNVMIVTRCFSSMALLRLAAIAALLCAVLSVASDPAGFAFSVIGESIYGHGLSRFAALGMHPNLGGFVYGGSAILMWQYGATANSRQRIVYMVGAMLSLSIVLAASSRAGVVAFFGAFFLSKLFGLRALTARKILHSAMVLMVPLVALAFVLESAIEYVIRVLDLNSQTRGFGSGGTGRMELWSQGFNLIGTRDMWQIIFGSGIRSTNPDDIGFSTESSYITIWLENGIVLGTIFIFTILLSAIRLTRQGAYGDREAGIVGCILLFAMIQSIFNRYLLAFGNPYSVLLLLTYASISHPTLRELHLKKHLRGA